MYVYIATRRTMWHMSFKFTSTNPTHQDLHHLYWSSMFIHTRNLTPVLVKYKLYVIVSWALLFSFFSLFSFCMNFNPVVFFVFGRLVITLWKPIRMQIKNKGYVHAVYIFLLHVCDHARIRRHPKLYQLNLKSPPWCAHSQFLRIIRLRFIWLSHPT